MNGYSWVTTEMFDEELGDVVEECGWDVGDVRSTLAEHYNNTVLEGLVKKYGPQFDHECDGCVFLGRWAWSSPDGFSGEADLYFCKMCDEGQGGSVLCRHGRNPDEYTCNVTSFIDKELKHRENVSLWGRGLIEGLKRVKDADLFTAT